MAETLINLTFDKNELIPILFGQDDKNINKIEERFAVSINSRGNKLSIIGNEKNVIKAKNTIESLYILLDKTKKNEISNIEIETILKEFAEHKNQKFSYVNHNISIKTKKKQIFPYSQIQIDYIKALQEKDIVFCTGPAGTGKTYLAVAMAVNMFLSQKVERIILCRPAVDAGEKLGFLPGDLKEKIDPYLRPLFDSLHDMINTDTLNKLMNSGEIEVAPLAFMRGRTLNNAFIILDEAQNSTPIQMKMFLTRIGEGSKIVVAGDTTQIDLPPIQGSGLKDAITRLSNINEIGFIKFQEEDIIRHRLTAKIVKAYNKNPKYKKEDSHK